MIEGIDKMKINNITQIKAEDFPEDAQQMAEQLGLVLNPFMQQVVEINDNRLDFENRVENFRQVEMTVDATGKPVLNNKINVGKTGIRGISIIAAFNQTNVAGFPTQQPFISYTVLSGSTIEVKNISGLLPNQKYLLNMVIY